MTSIFAWMSNGEYEFNRTHYERDKQSFAEFVKESKTITIREAIVDGVEYFVCKKANALPNSDAVIYWSECKNGRKQWSVKPGIALRYLGGNDLRKFVNEQFDKGVFVRRVPANADKKWRRR